MHNSGLPGRQWANTKVTIDTAGGLSKGRVGEMEKQTEILKKMGKKEQNRIVKHYGVTTKGVTYV